MFAPFSGTLNELAVMLDRAVTVSEVFGDGVGGEYRRLVRICHPDLFPAGPRGRQERVPEAILRRLAEKLEVPDLTEAHQVQYILTAS